MLLSEGFNLVTVYELHRNNNTFPDGFKKEINEIKGISEAILLLSSIVVKVMKDYLYENSQIDKSHLMILDKMYSFILTSNMVKSTQN
jgi:hypothetical protein